MGIEKEVAQNIRRTKIRQALLGSLQTAGLVAIAVLAPNALSIIGKAITRSSLNSTKSSLRRLADAGYVTFAKSSGNLSVQITEKGERYLIHKLGHFPKPKKWDGKWRVVIFDIPENRRKVRVKLREMLTYIGFMRLQNSVWVYPYDCEDVITLLKTESRIGLGALYMVVDKIENDKVIRSYFGIPKQR